MSKNYIFREFKCNLSIEQTAELCFKSVRTVKSWDGGSPIPRECKRLMKLASKSQLHLSEQWEGFRMIGDKLELPTGNRVTPQEILIGAALVEINSELELKTKGKILKYVRAINNILKLK